MSLTCPKCARPARRIVKGVCDVCYHQEWLETHPEQVAVRRGKYAQKAREERRERREAGLPTRRWGKVVQPCAECREERPHYSLGLCRPCYRKRPGRIHVCSQCQRVGEHQAQGLCKVCYMSAYAARNPDKVARHRRKQELKKRYGLTPEQAAGLLAANLQCQICARSFGPELKPHLDHCHAQGHIRGVLCAGCNKSLGLMADDSGRLRAAADYLDRTKT